MPTPTAANTPQMNQQRIHVDGVFCPAVMDMTPGKEYTENKDFYYWQRSAVTVRRFTDATLDMTLRESTEVYVLMDLLSGKIPSSTATHMWVETSVECDVVVNQENDDGTDTIRAWFIPDFSCGIPGPTGAASDMGERSLTGTGGQFFEVNAQGIFTELVILAGSGPWTGTLTNVPPVNPSGNYYESGKYALSVLAMTATGANISRGVNCKKMRITTGMVTSGGVISIAQAD